MYKATIFSEFTVDVLKKEYFCLEKIAITINKIKVIKKEILSMNDHTYWNVCYFIKDTFMYLIIQELTPKRIFWNSSGDHRKEKT